MVNRSVRPRTVRKHLYAVQPQPRGSRYRWFWWSVALSLAIAGTVWGYLHVTAGPPPETVVAARGMLEVTAGAEALLVRRETVHLSPAAGEAVRLVDEGERVRVGSHVVEVRPAAASKPDPVPPPEVEPDAAGKEQQLQEMIAQFRALNEQIYRLAAQLREAESKGDAAAVEKLQEQMDDLAQKQGELADRMVALEQGRKPAQVRPKQQASRPAGPGAASLVEAQAAGIVVYRVDGLEHRHSPASLNRLTPAQVKALTAEEKVLDGMVQAGQPLFKVVENTRLWSALLVPSADAADLKQGQRVTTRLQSFAGKPVAWRVDRKVTQGDETLLVLVSESTFPDELVTPRRTPVHLVLKQHSGFVVPAGAIQFQSDRAGVYLWDGRKSRFQPVKVIGKTGTHVAFEAEIEEGARLLTMAPVTQK